MEGPIYELELSDAEREVLRQGLADWLRENAGQPADVQRAVALRNADLVSRLGPRIAVSSSDLIYLQAAVQAWGRVRDRGATPDPRANELFQRLGAVIDPQRERAWARAQRKSGGNNDV